jgi:hypothetical protein
MMDRFQPRVVTEASRTATVGARSAASLVLVQYVRTFGRTQFTIGLVALAVLLRTHRPQTVLVYLALMQLGAVAGAVWATRLKSKRPLSNI